jgi:agmatinase
MPVTAQLNPVPIGRATFLDVPRCTDLDHLDAHIAVIGVPFGVPYDIRRLSVSVTAPQAIREASLRFSPRYLSHYDFEFRCELLAGRAVKIVDCGDVAMLPGRLEENSRATTEAIRAILGRGAMPIVIGGEHSIPIPVMRAYEGRQPMCVVQIDAHPDWRDEVDGIQEGRSSPMRRASEMPWVKGMAQIGLRGWGSARRMEVEAARAYGSVLVTAEELHRVGVDEVLRRVPAAERYYFTLDADGLDPSIAPGVAGPWPGGVTYFEASNLIRGVAARGKLVGFDLVEVVPEADVANMTCWLAARLIINVIGALAHTGQLG